MFTAKELYYALHIPRKYEDKTNVVYLCKKVDLCYPIDSVDKELRKEFHKRINTYDTGLIEHIYLPAYGKFLATKVTIGSKREQVYRELGFKEEV